MFCKLYSRFTGKRISMIFLVFIVPINHTLMVGSLSCHCYNISMFVAFRTSFNVWIAKSLAWLIPFFNISVTKAFSFSRCVLLNLIFSSFNVQHLPRLTKMLLSPCIINSHYPKYFIFYFLVSC